VKVYLLGPLRLTTSHVMWKGLRDMSVTRDTQPARHRSQAAKVQAVHMCVTVRSANFAANQYSTVQAVPGSTMYRSFWIQEAWDPAMDSSHRPRSAPRIADQPLSEICIQPASSAWAAVRSSTTSTHLESLRPHDRGPCMVAPPRVGLVSGADRGAPCVVFPGRNVPSCRRAPHCGRCARWPSLTLAR
jgi:hypothetical protein